jgi:hypothetical protein
MTTLKLVIDVPNYTANELREAISLIDSLEDDEPIEPEFVSAYDVIQAVAMGKLGLDGTVTSSDEKGYWKFVVDEIEDQV